MLEKKNIENILVRTASFRIISCYASIRQNFRLTHFPCGSPPLGGPTHYTKQCEQYIFIISHIYKWMHLLCKHTTTFELSLINPTVYMAFQRQPLLFTETVPHNAYETVTVCVHKGNDHGEFAVLLRTSCYEIVIMILYFINMLDMKYACCRVDMRCVRSSWILREVTSQRLYLGLTKTGWFCTGAVKWTEQT